MGIARGLKPQQFSYMARNEAWDWIWRKEGRVERPEAQSPAWLAPAGLTGLFPEKAYCSWGLGQ